MAIRVSKKVRRSSKFRPLGPRFLRQRKIDPRVVPPDSWPGSDAEYAVYLGHLKLGLREGRDFRMQVGLERGRRALGGQVIDFIELGVPYALLVQGEYWHYRRGAGQLVRDLVARSRLPLVGYQGIVVDDTPALHQDPAFYVAEARRGVSHARVR